MVKEGTLNLGPSVELSSLRGQMNQEDLKTLNELGGLEQMTEETVAKSMVELEKQLALNLGLNSDTFAGVFEDPFQELMLDSVSGAFHAKSGDKILIQEESKPSVEIDARRQIEILKHNNLLTKE